MSRNFHEISPSVRSQKCLPDSVWECVSGHLESMCTNKKVHFFNFFRNLTKCEMAVFMHIPQVVEFRVRLMGLGLGLGLGKKG